MMASSPELPEEIRKQIDEALARAHAERLPSERPTPRPPPRVLALPDWRPRTPKDLLLVGLLLALAAWMLPLPFRPQLLLIGLVLVGVALLSMLLRPHGRSQPYWRGRPVSLSSDSWAERLYRLLYRG
jgi:hypothetical protein